MKIQNRGMTIDLGYAIESGNDITDLFVGIFQEQDARCINWLKDVNNSIPLILSGQIGIGKTTFLNNLFYKGKIKPDIHLSFDRDDFVISTEGFLGYLYFKVILKLKELEIDTSKWDGVGSPIATLEKTTDMLASAFMFHEVTTKGICLRKRLLKLFRDNENDFKVQIREMLDSLLIILDRLPLIFCEGIDKYQPSKADFHLLLPVLSLLSGLKSKILYELNLLHIINLDFDWIRKENLSIVLTASDNKAIQEILERRLGIYADFRKAVLPLLARLSGGNPRQAIRLLAEFEYAYEQLRKSRSEAVNYACDRVREGFLKSGSVDFSPKHLEVVKRDGYYKSPEESPLYWNWVLATDDPEHGVVPVKINPLLLPAIESFEDITPSDPEIEKLKKWAYAHNISPFGLTIPADMNYNDFIDQMNVSKLWETELTLEDIFNEMASFFLNQRFNSLYLILYNDLETAHIASDYICGQAAVLGEKYFGEATVDKKIGNFNAFDTLLEKYDGLSLFFDESLTEDEVKWCETKRDQLIGRRIIFWIKRDKGIRYLNTWPHFRQFFRVLQLEKEILKGISLEDIENDIEQLEEVTISDEDKRISKEKLERVLHFLKKEAKQYV